MAGIKWIGSKHDNPTLRGIPRASAVIVLNDPETHFPVAIMEGGEISGMRTAGVTVLACEYLARPGFQAVALIGCGFIGRLHALGLLESFPAIERLYLYDHNRRAARALAEELASTHPELSVTVCEAAEEAVCRGELVVPCTVTARPYIELDWLMPGAFVSNISIMDVKPEVYLGVDKLLVDDWEQANRERKTINQLVLAGRLRRVGPARRAGRRRARAQTRARAPRRADPAEPDGDGDRGRRLRRGRLPHRARAGDRHVADAGVAPRLADARCASATARCYVIVGPPRTASTALARILWNHPQVGFYATSRSRRRGTRARASSAPPSCWRRRRRSRTLGGRGAGGALVVKEMTFQVGDAFPLLAALATRPIVFLIRDPRLSSPRA